VLPPVVRNENCPSWPAVLGIGITRGINFASRQETVRFVTQSIYLQWYDQAHDGVHASKTAAGTPLKL
jgi:hypothetical protein